jgi:hypothetical protein
VVSQALARILIEGLIVIMAATMGKRSSKCWQHIAIPSAPARAYERAMDRPMGLDAFVTRTILPAPLLCAAMRAG